MKPVEFEGQTTLLGPPKEMKRGTCGALPVYVDLGEPGELPRFLSFWKAGEYVVLSVYGGGHPPVWVDVAPCKELP